MEFVLHQAALVRFPRSIKYPLLYEETNIKGTLNMMQAALDAGVKGLSMPLLHLCMATV